jgi:hypothetical protein
VHFLANWIPDSVAFLAANHPPDEADLGDFERVPFPDPSRIIATNKAVLRSCDICRRAGHMHVTTFVR